MVHHYADERAVIPLSLPGTVVRRLNQLALERRTTRSALIRAAITATYFAHPHDQQGDVGPGAEGTNHDK